VLSVDPASGAPPYEQLRRQVVEQVAAGMLRPGARLPPVRRLAEELGLAAGTVARAYRELEAAGVVETRGRAGTVVAPTGDRTEQQAQAATLAYLAELGRLGLDGDDALRLVDQLRD
jgi:DNA-binding transcriptional regulator YhcF (GntR family)